MAQLEVPPAVGTTGQLLDVVVANAASTILRQIIVVGSPTSTSAQMAVGTDGNARVVTASSGFVQVSGNITSTATTLTSGTVTLSSVHTVTATQATNPWSSAPGFNVPMVSASSGLVQISGTPTVSSTATTISSGTVTLSSVHTVTATAATNPWSSAPGFNVPIISASSGLIQISGSVTATAATNPWSSAPGFNLPVVSVSSGLVQISGTPTILSASSGLVQISGTPFVNIVGTSSGVVPATTSGGLGVTILGGAASGSTAVNIVGTSGGIAPVTTSGGLNVTIVAGTISASTAVSLSSTPFVNLVGTSSGVAPVTTSGGLGVTILAGAAGSTVVSLSSVHTVTATAATNPWSSAPGFNIPVVSVSSGFVQISGNVTSTATTLTSGTVTLSSVHTVTATAGTNPWSSAPGFNVPVVSVSSGRVQTIASSGYPYQVFTFGCSSSASITTVSTAPRLLYGWSVGSATAGLTCLRIYNSTAATVGSTTNLIVAIPIPGSTGLGAGSNMYFNQGIEFDSRIQFVIVDSFNTTSTTLGTHAAGDITGTLYLSSS